MSLRGVDLLALTVLWGVLLIGAVLIASVGGEVFALAVLWLVVLMGAVLLGRWASMTPGTQTETTR